MKFSYNWLQSYFDKPLPKPDELAKLLTRHSFEIEEVTTRHPMSCNNTTSDVVLDLDILPNRAPDCSSHMGIAKECSVISGCEIKEIEIDFKASDDLKTSDELSLDIQEPELCPRYTALLIKNVKVGPSPDWLKERLEVIGQKSINNIVDIGNYVMLETGQPLHAFDLDKLEGKKIVVRLAENGEKITTLDNQNPVLDETVLVIADGRLAPLGGDPLAIAGIKGGKKAEITEETKDIIIEAAIFDSVNIRRTSKKIGIKTDASYRFEHGVSMFLPEMAIKRVAKLVQDIAGGEVAKESAEVLNKKPSLTSVSFTQNDFEKLIGIKISEDEINKILNNLGFSVEKSDDKFIVSPSKWRLDINIKEDLIEEIVRIYGFENIKSEMPGEVMISKKRNEEYFISNLAKGFLADMGFTEVYNYSFQKTGKIELKNPIASDKKYLRINLKQGLRLNVAENLKNFDELKLFEVGKVFDNNFGERMYIAFIVAGKKKNEEEISKEIKGSVKDFLNKLGIIEIDKFNECINGNIFECDLNRIIELAGENLELPKIQNYKAENIEYKPFSKFPAIIRDVSLFVPTGTKVIEVMDIIESTGGELLIDTDLFDEYLPPGGENKSLAFRLIFQSFEKTLTDDEVNELRDKIISSLEENKLWEVRR